MVNNLNSGWITIKEASKLLNIPTQQLRLMLQSEKYPELGFCFKRPYSNQYKYYITKDNILKFQKKYCCYE